MIDATPEQVWQLLGDPRRHPEWWPRVVEVSGEELDGALTAGTRYKQVTKSAEGIVTTDFSIEHLEDCREVCMRCLDTGMYSRWLLTAAQGATFLEVELGMEPTSLGPKVFDVVAGRRYFRRWLEQSVDALKDAVAHQPAA